MKFLIDTDTLMGPRTETVFCTRVDCVSKSALQSFLTDLETRTVSDSVIAKMIADLPDDIKTDACGHSDLIYLITKTLDGNTVTPELVSYVIERAKYVIKLYKLLDTAS